MYITYNEALQLLHADGYQYGSKGGYVFRVGQKAIDEPDSMAAYELRHNGDTAQVVAPYYGGIVVIAAKDLSSLPEKHLQALITARSNLCPYCDTPAPAAAHRIVECSGCPALYRIQQTPTETEPCCNHYTAPSSSFGAHRCTAEKSCGYCCLYCTPAHCFDPDEYSTPCRAHANCPYTYNLLDDEWTHGTQG